MGSRVNVVIVRSGGWRHYGSNSLGYSVDAFLALGPGPSLAVFEAHPVWDRTQWQYDSLCEAGALIDVDRRVLLMFVPDWWEWDNRIVMRETCRRTWPGWTVGWAYDGLSDLTDAVGVPRDLIRREPAEPACELFPSGEGPEDDPIRYLVSVTDGAETRCYPLNGWSNRPWRLGPALLTQLAGRPTVVDLDHMPLVGLHLDLASRRAGLWSLGPLHGLISDFPTLWPDWTVEFWQERYTEQAIRCAGALRLPSPDLAAARDRLANRVDDHWRQFVVERLDETIQSNRYLRLEIEDGFPTSPFWDGQIRARLTHADLDRLCELIRRPTD